MLLGLEVEVRVVFQTVAQSGQLKLQAVIIQSGQLELQTVQAYKQLCRYENTYIYIVYIAVQNIDASKMQGCDSVLGGRKCYNYPPFSMN